MNSPYPPALRAFLSALSVQPNITRAARAAAAAFRQSDAAKADKLQELLRQRKEDPENFDPAALAAAEDARRRLERLAQAIRRQHHDRAASQPEYHAAAEAAQRLGMEAVQDWAVEIATDGWDEPVFQGGFQVGVKRKFSQRVLLRYLETKYPDTWGKRELKVDASVSTTSIALAAVLTFEELQALEEKFNQKL